MVMIDTSAIMHGKRANNCRTDVINSSFSTVSDKNSLSISTLYRFRDQFGKIKEMN